MQVGTIESSCNLFTPCSYVMLSKYPHRDFESVFVCSCMCTDITTGNIHSYINSENQIHIHMTLLTLNDLRKNIDKALTYGHHKQGTYSVI